MTGKARRKRMGRFNVVGKGDATNEAGIYMPMPMTETLATSMSAAALAAMTIMTHLTCKLCGRT